MANPRQPPRLLAISDRRHPEWPGLRSWARELSAGGVTLLLREKDLDDRPLIELARSLRAMATGPVFVSARTDLAAICGLDGVHLPSRGLPLGPLRERFEPAFLFGRSTHTLREVEAAAAEGADYVTFGPVWDSPSKRGLGRPTGLAALERAARVGVPVLGLGGVTPERFEELASAGAWGAAGIRLFLDPTTAVRTATAGRSLFERGC